MQRNRVEHCSNEIYAICNEEPHFFLGRFDIGGFVDTSSSKSGRRRRMLEFNLHSVPGHECYRTEYLDLNCLRLHPWIAVLHRVCPLERILFSVQR